MGQFWRAPKVDGKEIDIGPGQALCIPRGAIHRFDNNGIEDVKAVCVVTPAAIGPEYFREAAALINATAGWQPDRTKMGEIMGRHGLTAAPSPIYSASRRQPRTPRPLKGILGDTHERGEPELDLSLRSAVRRLC